MNLCIDSLRLSFNLIFWLYALAFIYIVLIRVSFIKRIPYFETQKIFKVCLKFRFQFETAVSKKLNVSFLTLKCIAIAISLIIKAISLLNVNIRL